ncbi:hypothetical protein J6590_094731 [Homalodisca vitripennis]|nr:hypothetical protein J6590_094731 [Homalodisca vitripennis]
MYKSCRESFKELKLLTLPALYVLETRVFCRFRCTLMQGRDVHGYNKRAVENYRVAQHRQQLHGYLPSQMRFTFILRAANEINRLLHKQILRAIKSSKHSYGEKDDSLLTSAWMFPTESQCFPFCSLFSWWKRTKHAELYQGCKQAGAPRKSCSDQVVGNDESRVAGGIFVVEFEDDFNIRPGAGDPVF